MTLPFFLQSPLEARIAADPEFLEGVEYGRPRPGHPEGAVKFHIAEVLANVEQMYAESPLYESLRLIALVHDTFKYQVDPDKPKSGPNHHGAYARRFAARYIDDQATLEVIELHDEAYNAWQQGHRKGKWDRAEERAERLLERLGETLDLYLAFYVCDNATGDKGRENLEWFVEFVEKRG